MQLLWLKIRPALNSTWSWMALISWAQKTSWWMSRKSIKASSPRGSTCKTTKCIYSYCLINLNRNNHWLVKSMSAKSSLSLPRSSIQLFMVQTKLILYVITTLRNLDMSNARSRSIVLTWQTTICFYHFVPLICFSFFNKKSTFVKGSPPVLFQRTRPALSIKIVECSIS